VSELVAPFVVRIERDSPPARTDALEAAARAVLLLLSADRPEWAEAIAAWDGQRIRKVVRRARGADWRRALTVDGLDVEHRSARLRVYPPVPVDAWPPELARLQVGGTILEDAAPPGEPPAGVPVVLLSPHVQMTTGKAMAQAAHAAQLGRRAMPAGQREAWQAAGFPLAVRDATAAKWTRALDSGAEVVHDGGFTEVAPGTATAAWTWPSPASPSPASAPPAFEVRPVSDDQWPIVVPDDHIIESD
jgi:peptidyl-tRNA hydrolase